MQVYRIDGDPDVWIHWSPKDVSDVYAVVEVGGRLRISLVDDQARELRDKLTELLEEV